MPIMNRDVRETNKDKLIFALKLLATYQAKDIHMNRRLYTSCMQMQTYRTV